LNFAGTFYGGSTNLGQYGRWRDVQASLQFERKLGGVIAYPGTLASLATFSIC
jgi:hypothetical protein